MINILFYFLPIRNELFFFLEKNNVRLATIIHLQIFINLQILVEYQIIITVSHWRLFVFSNLSMRAKYLGKIWIPQYLMFGWEIIYIYIYFGQDNCDLWGRKGLLYERPLRYQIRSSFFYLQGLWPFVPP